MKHNGNMEIVHPAKSELATSANDLKQSKQPGIIPIPVHLVWKFFSDTTKLEFQKIG